MPRFLQHTGRRRPSLLPGQRSAREVATLAAPALAAGAALEYFLDPRSGRRRRHSARERVNAAFRRRARRIERQTRYETGKVVGLAHKLRPREHAAAELDDIGLVRKVETELFRDRTIPKGRVSINADRGIVVLRGQLDDARDIERIGSQVRSVAGVREVENLLHLPGTPAPASRPHGDPRSAHPAA